MGFFNNPVLTKWQLYLGFRFSENLSKIYLISTVDKVFFSKPSVYLTLCIEKFLQYSIFSIPAGDENGFKTILLQVIFWPATNQKQ